MWIVFGLILAVLVAALVYLAMLDGKIQVERKLEIDATREAVFAAVLDLKTWPQWSPWLMHEADADIEFAEDCQVEGGFYRWQGEVIGAGNLTHLKISSPASISQEIEFLRPYKSVGRILWEFEPGESGTRVSWTMNAEMPFLFRFMARRMQAMIERDYELGLALLGGYLDTDKAYPTIEFSGSEELQDFNYWAIPCNGNLRQLEAARRPGVETLQNVLGSNAGLALTLYYQFDPLGSHYQAEIAVPVADNTPLSNYRRREFKGGRYFKMTLHGDLQFLPLAWYAIHSHCRMHKLKLDSTRPALEIYHDDLTQIPDKGSYTTSLYIPITQNIKTVK